MLVIYDMFQNIVSSIMAESCSSLSHLLTDNLGSRSFYEIFPKEMRLMKNMILSARNAVLAEAFPPIMKSTLINNLCDNIISVWEGIRFQQSNMNHHHEKLIVLHMESLRTSSSALRSAIENGHILGLLQTSSAILNAVEKSLNELWDFWSLLEDLWKVSNFSNRNFLVDFSDSSSFAFEFKFRLII